LRQAKVLIVDLLSKGRTNAVPSRHFMQGNRAYRNFAQIIAVAEIS